MKLRAVLAALVILLLAVPASAHPNWTGIPFTSRSETSGGNDMIVYGGSVYHDGGGPHNNVKLKAALIRFTKTGNLKVDEKSNLCGTASTCSIVGAKYDVQPDTQIESYRTELTVTWTENGQTQKKIFLGSWWLYNCDPGDGVVASTSPRCPSS